MKSRKLRGISLSLFMVFALVAGALVFQALAQPLRGDSAYPVNANGQTYGTVGIVEDPATYVEPDLIACMGTDGTVGYCYKVDLDGEQPSTPEEALEYMARLAENGYTREIPLYESDGETVIGQFVLSPPSTIEG